MPFLNKSTLVLPATSTFPGGIWQDKRDPLITDFRNFEIGTLWINFQALRAWIMVDRTASTGIWIQMASTGTGIMTITGNSGGAVSGDGSNNINVLGNSPISISGVPSTHTLNVSLSGLVAQSFPTDSGTAFPAAGALTVHGGAGITTSGSASTVTITAAASVPTTFTENSGSAIPALNNLNILGTSGITTSGAGSTVTITTDGTVATLYTTNSGTAIPSGGNLNVFGAGSSVTSAAGSTITITSTGGGIAWIEVFVVGPTTMSVNTGYVANNGSQVSLLLPSTAAFGSIIRIVGKGAGGWKITQGAGQQILMEGSSSTIGASGSLASSATHDTVELLCTIANTTFTVIDGNGNYIIT